MTLTALQIKIGLAIGAGAIAAWALWKPRDITVNPTIEFGEATVGYKSQGRAVDNTSPELSDMFGPPAPTDDGPPMPGAAENTAEGWLGTGS